MLFKVVTTEKQLDINVDKKQLKHGRVGGELGAKKVPRRNGTARDCRDAGEGKRRRFETVNAAHGSALAKRAALFMFTYGTTSDRSEQGYALFFHARRTHHGR
jgi:hypothetical protein